MSDNSNMTSTSTIVAEPEVDLRVELARPWNIIVWNDPINLMTYVTRVFMTVFGYSKEKSERLMMEVHNDGRSLVASGAREAMEQAVTRLHEFGLWATLEQAS